ncbi:MAG TPA: protein kinase [Thermoanaerobaculia bacterium]|nr:protein kinase [Thermoanaerobaculia bacterium]
MLPCPSCGQGNSEFDSRCVACGAALPVSSSTTLFDGGRPPPRAASAEPFAFRQIHQYRLLRPLGHGGMGVVYLAEDIELGREVALKFLRHPRDARPADETRFRREAKAAASLDHPNIGTIFEIGEHEGLRFLAMAYYEGTTLAQLLAGRPDRRLATLEAAAIAGQLAAALAAAHAAGIVHRDLKPENVMVLPDGRVKLLDFGLARWIDSGNLTEEGTVLGTAAYMAPEQLKGLRVGTATDLWALGMVLYEMLAGRRPFGGERQGMIHSILVEDPLPLREAVPDVSAALETIAARCLAKEPRERPSAVAVLAELQASGLWAGSGSGAVIPSPRRSWRTWAVASVASTAAVLLVLAIAVAIWLLTRKPALPVYVAVLKPEVAGSLSPDDQARVTANIQAALLRTVAALDGLAALDFNKVNAVKGPPTSVARAVAAGEVIASRADCAGDVCHVSLQRLSGQDGRVLWAEALEVLSARPRLFADAVTSTLRRGYGDRRLRVPRLELEIQEKDYETFLDLRRRITKEGASDETLARLEELRTRAPSFVEAYALEAQVARRRYADTGETRYLTRGLAVVQDAIRIAPGDPRPLVVRFELELSAGHLDEAEAALASLEEIDPAESLLQRGRLAERWGRPAEGLELMQAAVRLQPSWPNLLILANAEYRQGRLDDARRHLEALLTRFPGNLEGLRTLAQIELLRNPEHAVALLREAAKSDPGIGSLTNLGGNLLLLRRYGEAEASLRQALARQPGDPSAALNLADCLTLLGREAEARQLYAGIAESASRRATPGDWSMLAVQAQAFAHLGENDQALEAIQQALRLTPNNSQLSMEAAVVYVLIGDRSSALFHARQAAKQNVDASWLALPFFDPLRKEPTFQALTRPR